MAVPAHVSMMIATLRRRSYAAAAPPPAPSGAAPLIIYTNNPSGPVSDTGGDGTGCCITIRGKNLLPAAGFGGFDGINSYVAVGGVKVANYRCITTPGGTLATKAGYQDLTVQVGALTGLTPGVAYPIDVVIDGVGPSNDTSGGNFLMPFDVVTIPITFTVQPGSMIFVAAADHPTTPGNDANPGTFDEPKLTLQSSDGSAGVYKINSSANAEDGMKPGTHVCRKAGGSDYSGVGFNSSHVSTFRITGTAPDGNTNRGWICDYGWPGAAGSNSRPVVHINMGSGYRGFNGNDSARSTEVSTSWGGFTGWTQFISISDMKISCHADSGSDRSPMNMQSNFENNRLTGLEITWPSTVTGAGRAQCAGMEGVAQSTLIMGNWIHDVNGDPGFVEQHDVYLDSNGSGASNVAHDVLVACNDIDTANAGNNIQTYDGVNGAGMYNIWVIGNSLRDPLRCNLNISSYTQNLKAYNNLGEGAGYEAVRIVPIATTAANDIVVSFNTLYGWGMVSANRYAIICTDVSIGTGTARADGNILLQKPSHAANGYGFFATSAAALTADGSHYYDPNGNETTKYSGDATGTFSDPLLVDAPNGDFRLQSGSPCRGTGPTPVGFTRTFDAHFNRVAANDRGALVYVA